MPLPFKLWLEGARAREPAVPSRAHFRGSLSTSLSPSDHFPRRHAAKAAHEDPSRSRNPLCTSQHCTHLNRLQASSTLQHGTMAIMVQQPRLRLPTVRRRGEAAALLLVLALVPPSLSADNGLALVPPRGWLGWTTFRCQVFVRCDTRGCSDPRPVVQTVPWTSSRRLTSRVTARVPTLCRPVADRELTVC